jgi:hypothetical protein
MPRTGPCYVPKMTPQVSPGTIAASLPTPPSPGCPVAIDDGRLVMVRLHAGGSNSVQLQPCENFLY